MENKILDADMRRPVLSGDEQVLMNQKIGLLNEQLKTIGYGRKALIFIAVFTLLYVLISLFGTEDIFSDIDSLDILIGGIITLAIYGLAYWASFRKPRIAFGVALVFYLVIFISDVLLGVDWYRGIIFKIAITYFLATALQATFKHKKLLQELNYLGLDYERRDQAMKYRKIDRLKIVASATPLK